jgi:hypothetical protein
MVEESVEKKEVSQKEGTQTSERSAAERVNDVARKLDAVGWGLFLIWLGIVLLAKAQTSVALLGIGIIMLGVQLARLVLKIKWEGFWFVVGLLFIIGSLWQLANTRIELIPILLIAAGLALVLTRFLPRQVKKKE